MGSEDRATPAIQHRTAATREKRAGAIAAYAGTAGRLALEAAGSALAPRVRTFAQDATNDLQRALELLRTIEGLGIVVHGPAGCAGTLHGDGPAAPWAVTGLDQRDSIMGGDGRLREAIRRLHAQRGPRAIVVLGTPVVAINGDELQTVTDELSEELGIPIAPILTDGFRSRIGATGHDVAVHGLLKHLLPQRQAAAASRVNLLAVAEGAEEVQGLRRLLLEAGIESRTFPRGASVEGLREIVNAVLSVSVDPDESEYAGQALRQLRGVPYLSPPAPIGAAGTAAWLAAVGEAMGLDVSEVAARQGARLAGAVARLAPHAGARVFVSLPAAQAFAVAGLVRELGLSVAGIGVPSIGPAHAGALRAVAAADPGIPVLVGEGQAFEEVNLLRTLGAELLVSRGTAPLHALRLGVPVLDLASVPVLGFDGLEGFAEAARRRLANPALARFFAGGREPYLPGWLSKSTHWFIKHEVK
ncbi:MAG TPA: nitrogenase component 1 [Anaeromyxobacteraceae bacterium]|nr:nitrogenase component 1 [Anaeromyxobacteraceae bacterium]